MTILAVPFNAVGQKATVDQWQIMGQLWAPSGVVADAQPITVSGLQWTIPPLFRAWVHGFLADNDVDPVTVDGVANNSTQPRYDRLVLRLSKTAKTITPVVIQGTAAASPQPPAIDPATDIMVALALKPGSGSPQNYGTPVPEWSPVTTDRRRNGWTGTGSFGPGNNATAVGTWTDVWAEGLIVRSGNAFTMTQPGPLKIHLHANAGSSYGGESLVRISWPGGPWQFLGDELMTSTQTRSPSDSSDQVLSWSGIVRPAEILQPFRVLAGWTPDGSTAKSAFTFALSAEYGN